MQCHQRTWICRIEKDSPLVFEGSGCVSSRPPFGLRWVRNSGSGCAHCFWKDSSIPCIRNRNSKPAILSPCRTPTV